MPPASDTVSAPFSGVMITLGASLSAISAIRPPTGSPFQVPLVLSTDSPIRPL